MTLSSSGDPDGLAGGRRVWGIGAATTGLVLIVSLASSACGGVQASGGVAASQGDPPPQAGAPPDFELETLDGKTVRLGDHLGKDVVLLDFWATFCRPCLKAMPHLDALYQKYRSQGFVVLGISVDGPDSIAQVRVEAKKLGITFPVLLDQETRVVGLYNPRASAPFSVLIGRDSEILLKREGYTSADASALEADVRRALGR